MASQMDIIMILLLCLAPVLASNTQTSTYRKARDYLSVTSENYPHTYPGPDSWRWQWSVDTGLWAVMFVDFQLACDHDDTVVISDPGSIRNLTFSCDNPPYERYAYIVESSKFSMQLNSNGQGSQQTRGFKCQVLYGINKGRLQSKIDDMKTSQEKKRPGSTDDNDSSNNSSSSTNTTVDVILLPSLLVFFLLLVIVVAVAILMLKRRQMQQSNNTSVHLNIGAIRRDSSVSYTRHGNGPPPGARSRLDSDSSLAPDSASRPRRPAKRSESNASWAMRAEMNSASLRHGSCSSEGGGGGGGGGHHHGSSTAAPNEYTPCPGESNLPEVTHHHHVKTTTCKALPHALACRLSTICEEYSSNSSSSNSSNSSNSRPISCSSCNKLSASFPVPIPVQGDPEASLAIANAGYMLMTSCSANYVNCGHD